jgi:hypothetical protein
VQPFGGDGYEPALQYVNVVPKNDGLPHGLTTGRDSLLISPRLHSSQYFVQRKGAHPNDNEVAPDIQEQILFLPDSRGVNEKALRPVVSRINWEE